MEKRGIFSLKELSYLQIFENMEEKIHVNEIVRNDKCKIVDLIFKYINQGATLNSDISRENIIDKRDREISCDGEMFTDFAGRPQLLKELYGIIVNGSKLNQNLELVLHFTLPINKNEFQKKKN